GIRARNVTGVQTCALPISFVPERYLHNSADVRLAVLQGLLDSDGGPVTRAGRTCRIRYATNSIPLRDDVIELVRSLGGVAHPRRSEERRVGKSVEPRGRPT